MKTLAAILFIIMVFIILIAHAEPIVYVDIPESMQDRPVCLNGTVDNVSRARTHEFYACKDSFDKWVEYRYNGVLKRMAFRDAFHYNHYMQVWGLTRPVEEN